MEETVVDWLGVGVGERGGWSGGREGVGTDDEADGWAASEGRVVVGVGGETVEVARGRGESVEVERRGRGGGRTGGGDGCGGGIG